MLLGHDVVADRKAAARPLAGRLGGEELPKSLPLISGGMPTPLSRMLISTGLILATSARINERTWRRG